MPKIFLFIGLAFFLVPDTDWELRKDKSGIQVFTRKVEESSIDEFKGITTISNTNIYAVLDVLFDVESFTDLYPDCINPKVLKRESKYHDIHYIQTKGPITVKDRDSIFEQLAEINDNGKHAFVSLKPLPDFVPEKKNIVRIQKGTGYWELTEDDDKNVLVIYQFLGEPGGEIPAWIANSFIVSQPFKTLQNLSSILKSK